LLDLVSVGQIAAAVVTACATAALVWVTHKLHQSTQEAARSSDISAKASQEAAKAALATAFASQTTAEIVRQQRIDLLRPMIVAKTEGCSIQDGWSELPINVQNAGRGDSIGLEVKVIHNDLESRKVLVPDPLNYIKAGAEPRITLHIGLRLKVVGQQISGALTIKISYADVDGRKYITEYTPDVRIASLEKNNIQWANGLGSPKFYAHE
jgi:hypothetical protein